MDKSKEVTLIPEEPITRTTAVAVSPEQVWQVISSPGNLVKFHPFCQMNPVERWPGVGSKDKVIYYSGLILVRNFTAWIEGVGYDLDARSEDGMRFKVTWRIKAEGDNSSSLSVTITPYTAQGSSRRKGRYTRLLGSYLELTLKGFESYIHTGEQVRRNQFGSHRLFSPPVAEIG